MTPATTAADAASALLEPDELPPVIEVNRAGRSAFVIAVDHAGRAIPRRLNDLGVGKADLSRHIAWDIGALAVARGVSDILDAPLIAQRYSRLVIDCNRDPAVPTSIPTLSEHTRIPGNEDLSPTQRRARRLGVFDPYHQRLGALIDERLAAGRPTILVAQHSMTDCFKGDRRCMHAAVLYNRDPRLAQQVRLALQREPGLQIADNEPYSLSDDTDYTIPRHAEARGLLHVEIEIRQDLIVDERGQAAWAQRIAHSLQYADAALARAGQ
jgi:predicted N-formylglutamate amidohydrolase